MSVLAIIEKVTADREAALERAVLDLLYRRGRILPGEHLCTVSHDFHVGGKPIPNGKKTVAFFFPDYHGGRIADPLRI